MHNVPRGAEQDPPGSEHVRALQIICLDERSFRDGLYTELVRRSVTPQQCADMIRKQNQAIAAGVAIAAVGAAIAVCSNNNCGG